MKTARQILAHLRDAGMSARVVGRGLVIKPAEKLTPTMKQSLLRVKPELMHVLDGNYTQAAKSLVIRETAPGQHREDLAMLFDERVAMVHIEGASYGEACRTAYRELCRAIEMQADTPVEKDAAA